MGRLAQLVEHLVYTERVGGSSPSSPTNFGRGTHWIVSLSFFMAWLCRETGFLTRFFGGKNNSNYFLSVSLAFMALPAKNI